MNAATLEDKRKPKPRELVSIKVDGKPFPTTEH
jgi:hypothetical protein